MNDCFDLRHLEAKNETSEDHLQQIDDEKMALEAIYGSSFSEKIPGKLWQFEMDIPVLRKLIKVSSPFLIIPIFYSHCFQMQWLGYDNKLQEKSVAANGSAPVKSFEKSAYIDDP